MDSQGKQPSSQNTYLADVEDLAELARLIRQDKLITYEVMGGILADLPVCLEHVTQGTILDVACGPGEWARAFAETYPQSEVVAVDISRSMIAYATSQAKEQGLPNITFRVMDVTQPLDFPPATFDFINVRMLLHVFLNHMWFDFLKECYRVLNPDGGIRMTEIEEVRSTSPTATRLRNLYYEAMQRTGRGLSPRGEHINILPMLRQLLLAADFSLLQAVPYLLDSSTGAPLHEAWSENEDMALETMAPFLTKNLNISLSELRQLFDQGRVERQAPEYCSLGFFLSLFARKLS